MRKIMKKGQAALEFLSTYGWAFLVMLLMIGAVTSFIVFNPSMIPSQCTFESDVVCDDYTITVGSASQAFVVLKQTTGRPIYLSDFDCEDREKELLGTGYFMKGESKIDMGSMSVEDKKWDPREEVVLMCEFPGNPYQGFNGEGAQIFLEVTYQSRENGFDHTFNGELYSRIIG